MNYRPHLHTIVLGGGLDGKNHWKNKNGELFFPVKVMSAVFKKHYLKELKELWKEGRLEYHGTAECLRNQYEFKGLLDKLYSIPWVVYTKEAFGGAQSVIDYLGRYTHRIAISNRRIVRIEGNKVIYKAKDYKNGGKLIEMSVEGTEFIRMFLMHVLPKGFVKIRHYGILSCRNKKKKITICRNILGCKQYISKLRNMNTAEKINYLFHCDITKCKNCGAKLITYRVGARYSLC